MNPTYVLDAYVADVMRRVPARDRNEIGLELRDLLGELLAERADTEGRAADDAMVLALLRDFGAPAEVAARYRPPGTVIIPAHQTRSFAITALVGVALQWALTVPRALDGQALAVWWLGWGLGAFWWPGFLVTLALAAAWLRGMPRFQRDWQPRTVDPERIQHGPWTAGLVWSAIGAAGMTAMPWIVRALPDPLPQLFAFDPGFLRERAWPVVILWLLAIGTMATVRAAGRWSALTRQLDVATNLAFIALLGWWLVEGDIFATQSVDDSASAGIGVVIVLIVAELGRKLHRRRPRLHAPKIAG